MSRTKFLCLAFGLAIFFAATQDATPAELDLDHWHDDLSAAMSMAHDKNTEDAITILARLHKEHPDDPEVTRDYITVLDWGRHSDEIAKYYEAQNDTTPVEYLLLCAARAYDRLGQPQKAAELFHRGRNLYPMNTEFIVGELRTLIEQGRAGEVIDMSQSILSAMHHPSSDILSVVEEAHHVHAVQEARDGHYPDALKTLASLHEQHPEDNIIVHDYIAVLSWSGDDKTAVDIYHSLPTDKQPDYVYAAVGISLRNLKQPLAAANLYREALSHYPDNQNFKTGLVRSLLESQHTDAAAEQAQALSVEDKQTLSEVAQSTLNAKRDAAADLARAQHYDEALASLKDVILSRPNDTAAKQDYITVLAWAGHDSEATAAYEAKGDLPDNLQMLGAVAHAYRDQKLYSQAYALFARGHKAEPDNENFTVGMISALIDMGRFDESLALAKQDIATNGPRKTIGASIGEIGFTLRDRKQFVKALEAFQLAHEAEPDSASFTAGLVGSLGDLGRPDEARKLALLDLTLHPDHKDVLTALSTVAHDYRDEKKFATALAAYRQGLKLAPSDERFIYGIIGSLSDMKRFDEAAEIIQYDQAMHPDHALVASAVGPVGDGLLESKHFPPGLKLFQFAHHKWPDEERYTVGLMICLNGLKRYDEARQLMKDDLGDNPNHAQMLIAAANVANTDGNHYEALGYAQRAAALLPQNDGVHHMVVRETIGIGAPEAAAQLSTDVNDAPAIEGDQNAWLVRWGRLEPEIPTDNLKGSRIAVDYIQNNITAWKAQGFAKANTVSRARFDLIVAMVDSTRMQDAIDQYQLLLNEGITPPPYVMAAIGEAYLYLHQPEQARDILQQAAADMPKDFEVHRQLFYAYVECDEFKNAYATIDKLLADQPIWTYLPGENDRLANTQRAEAEVDVANARYFGGDSAKAQSLLEDFAAKAPFSTGNHEALARVYLARGWPRRSLEEFRYADRTAENQDIGAKAGMAASLLELRDYRANDEAVQNLSTLYPENLDVRETARQQTIHNMAELQVSAFYNLQPWGGTAAGGEGYGLQTTLYSPPVDYNWRLLAGTYYAHEDEPRGEGPVGFSQSRAGVEYSDEHIVATATPTFNLYNGNNRAGFSADGNYTFNDLWSAGIDFESLSLSTPLRALNSNITASRYAAALSWQASDTRDVKLSIDDMPFSDGNNRIEGGLTYDDRLYTTPYWHVDNIAEVGVLTDSENSQRVYFNPKADLTILDGPRVTQSLYRRYDFTYSHSLQLSPGLDAEEYYGLRPIWQAVYQQTLNLDDTSTASAQIDYLHRPYDGQTEDAVSFLLNYTQRF